MDIHEYLTRDGRSPFGVWLHRLRDVRARARIRVRLDRVRLGNLGDYRALGDGVYDLRLPYGPGYRIYFGITKPATVILLGGGDKRMQRRDIEQAKRYWADYLDFENDSH